MVSTEDALKRARDAEKDLVEVSPHADPPVAKIMDYAKYVYELKKKQKDAKKSGKVKPEKEFRFKPTIDVHDIQLRVRRAKEYLEKGHNVKLTMMRKGRQPHEQAVAKFEEILTKFEEYSSIDPYPKHEGRRIFITYKPNGKKQNEKREKSSENKEQSKDSPKKTSKDKS